MANNRLYIHDPETGDSFMLCKAFGDGWYFWHGGESIEERVAELNEWLRDHDRASSYGDEATRLELRDEIGDTA